MLELPKKHPWVLITLFYLLVVAGWAVFYVLAKNHSGNKRTPAEAEAILRNNQEELATPPSDD